MKRSRGRGRRQQNSVNRSYDSNGPDVRVRGTASQVYEKYQTLARDALLTGDRVNAENLQQHAEHYFRIMLANQPAVSETDNLEDGDVEADVGSEQGDERAAEPLVLMRGEDYDSEAEPRQDKSRRRGPLRRRRKDNGEGNENGVEVSGNIAPEAETEAPSEATVVAEAEVVSAVND